MFISIVIPVYNVSKELLSRSLNSALSQIDDNDEIVIVDDGSKIDKAEAYEQICKSDKRIHYFRQENSGPSVARNKGVEQTAGEYVFFLDADDYLTEGCIKQAKYAINLYHPDIVFGYVDKDLTDEGFVKYTLSDDNPEFIGVEGSAELAVLLNHILGYKDRRYIYNFGYISDGPVCRFFRRELFAYSKFDVVSRWNEDTLWNIELLRKCNKAIICKSLWYIYAVRKGSAMQGYRKNCYEEFSYITDKVSTVGYFIWNGNIDKGIAYRVWHDIFVLSRGLIFNKQNTDSLGVRYKVFKNAICSGPYQKAIELVDFSTERSKSRRIVKELLNGLMKLHLYYPVYLFIKIYVSKE